jgi:hypothetical protein
MKYKEPIRGKQCEFQMLDKDTLVPGAFQRNISSGLRGKLLKSMARGFATALTVVDRGDGFYEIIDGQHRMKALDELAEFSGIPCIIVPEEFRFQPLLLNTEKSDDVKDKCIKIHALYEWYIKFEPDTPEVNLESAVGYQSSLFSLAYGFDAFRIASPSMVESLANKLDAVIDAPVSAAVATRIERGGLLGDVCDVIEDIAQTVGFTDYNLKKAVLSKTTMELWGRKRNLGIEFNEGIDLVITKIQTTDWSGFAY